MLCYCIHTRLLGGGPGAVHMQWCNDSAHRWWCSTPQLFWESVQAVQMVSHYVGSTMWSAIVSTSLVQSTRGVHISLRCLTGIVMHTNIHHLAVRMSVLHDTWSTTSSNAAGVVNHLWSPLWCTSHTATVMKTTSATILSTQDTSARRSRVMTTTSGIPRTNDLRHDPWISWLS